MAEDLMSIGRLAERSGFSVKTLRYYDEIGLVRPARRNPVSRKREYAWETLRLLELVKVAKLSGLSLDETREIVAETRRPSKHGTAIGLIDRKLEEIGVQVVQLERLRERVIRLSSRSGPSAGRGSERQET